MKKQDRTVLYGVLMAVLSLALILLMVGFTNWRAAEAARRFDRIIHEEISVQMNGNFSQPLEIQKIRKDAFLPINQFRTEIVTIVLVFVAIVVAGVIIYSIHKDSVRSEKYEKARAEMIRGISHDLRTPLTVVKGNIKGIQDGIANSPEKQAQYLETAYARVLDIEDLLAELFETFNCETGDLKLKMERVNLNEFLKKVAKESVAKDKIEFDFPKEPVFVEIDSRLMKRVFDNLINNAVKHSGDAKKLKIEMGICQNGNMIDVTFRDNGKGVKSENLEKIFDEFYKEDESRNSEKAGSGLGLFIVKKIIEAHGGKISAENADGLKFSISLKAAEKVGRVKNA